MYSGSSTNYIKGFVLTVYPQDWHDALHSLLTCMDTACCAGGISQATAIPKSGIPSKLITINGTSPASQFLGIPEDLELMGAF